MQPNRLRSGEIMAGAGALALLVSLFFDWFRPEKGLISTRDLTELPVQSRGLAQQTVDRFVDSLAQSGFGGLGWLLVVLLLIAIVSALTLVALTVMVEPVGLTVGAAVITSAIGIVATLVLLIRLTLGQPDLGYGLADAQVHVMPAAYVGLVACALLGFGAWRALADERTGAPYSAPPDLPARPIPSS